MGQSQNDFETCASNKLVIRFKQTNKKRFLVVILWGLKKVVLPYEGYMIQ